MADDKSRSRRTDVIWEVEEGDDSEQRIRSAAKSLAQRLKDGNIKLPMLPAAAAEALRLAQDPSASMRALEQVVQTDPPVAVRVLTVANSAAYGNHNIRTLGQALSRLGTGTIRDILFQAVAESHIFQGNSAAELAAERDHAVATAQVARLVCKLLGIDGEYAFLCGLLHDLGRVALFDMIDERSGLSEQESKQLVARMHASVGSHLATEWNLPKLVPEACRRHHHYRAQGQAAYSQIGNVIAVADRITMHYGFGRPARAIVLAGEPAFFDLGLDPARLPELIEMAGPAVGTSMPRQPSQSGVHKAAQSGVYKAAQSGTHKAAQSGVHRAVDPADSGIYKAANSGLHKVVPESEAELSGSFAKPEPEPPQSSKSGLFARVSQSGIFRRAS